MHQKQAVFLAVPHGKEIMIHDLPTGQSNRLGSEEFVLLIEIFDFQKLGRSFRSLSEGQTDVKEVTVTPIKSGQVYSELVYSIRSGRRVSTDFLNHSNYRARGRRECMSSHSLYIQLSLPFPAERRRISFSFFDKSNQPSISVDVIVDYLHHPHLFSHPYHFCWPQASPSLLSQVSPFDDVFLSLCLREIYLSFFHSSPLMERKKNEKRRRRKGKNGKKTAYIYRQILPLSLSVRIDSLRENEGGYCSDLSYLGSLLS